MKQVIPFYKEIVFKKTIANLTSISLEHKETVLDGEVSGEFIIFGDYKVHNDTTEKEDFKYKLPFTALIPDDVDPNTVVIDIANFKYEQIDNDVLRIDIDFSIEGECLEEVEEVLDRIDEIEMLDDDIDKEIDEILNNTNTQEEILDEVEEFEEVDYDCDEEREEDMMKDIIVPNDNVVVEEVKETIIKEETKEEYVTYHVHVVGNSDSVESIMKLYNTNLDILNEYNDIKELKVGDKVLIPEYLDE